MNKKITYPILYIQPKTNDISASKISEMVADLRYLNDKKHCEKYNHDVLIVDVEGLMFRQEGLKQIGGVNFWLSLKWVGKIVRVEPILTSEVTKVTLEETKDLLLDIMRKKPKKWLPYGPMNLVEEMIMEKSTFLELMHFFNNKIKKS